MSVVVEGSIGFLVDNPHPFVVKVHVQEKVSNNTWLCLLDSKIHSYTEVYLHTWQIGTITAEDELIIELYERDL